MCIQLYYSSEVNKQFILFGEFGNDPNTKPYMVKQFPNNWLTMLTDWYVYYASTKCVIYNKYSG